MNDSYKIYDDFGDKILIATFPQNIPEEIMKLPTTDEQGAAFAKLPEEEQRRIAREYADRVCVHGKPSFYNFYAAHWLTPDFREELYKESRINYSKYTLFCIARRGPRKNVVPGFLPPWGKTYLQTAPFVV